MPVVNPLVSITKAVIGGFRGGLRVAGRAPRRLRAMSKRLSNGWAGVGQYSCTCASWLSQPWFWVEIM